jgi:hypothetical protein
MSSGMCRRVVLVGTDISEEHNRLHLQRGSVLQSLAIANVFLVR